MIGFERKEMRMQSKEYQKLRECPFCGGRAGTRRFSGKFFDVYTGYCMNEDCFIEPETRPYYSKKEAIEAWNRRANDGK